MSSSILRKVKKVPAKSRQFLRQTYQVFLDRIIIKFFPSPAVAIYSACQLAPFSPERVISNYYQGMILLGQDHSDKLVWKTFPQRVIITADIARVSSRLKRVIRQQAFEIRFNSDFEAIIRASQREKTWINASLIPIYRTLYAQGCVETIEIYQNGELVGGLWGVVANRNFGIMSMFHRANHAGTAALVTLINQLQDRKYHLIDGGDNYPVFERYGAILINCEELVERLAQSHFTPTAQPIAREVARISS
jgi:leucyl/phenylalanyl-tRNA---protein transferase